MTIVGHGMFCSCVRCGAEAYRKALERAQEQAEPRQARRPAMAENDYSVYIDAPSITNHGWSIRAFKRTSNRPIYGVDDHETLDRGLREVERIITADANSSPGVEIVGGNGETSHDALVSRTELEAQRWGTHDAARARLLET